MEFCVVQHLLANNNAGTCQLEVRLSSSSKHARVVFINARRAGKHPVKRICDFLWL